MGDIPLNVHIKNFELARKGIKTNAIMTRGMKNEDNFNINSEPVSK